jgi:hypothetical protein
MMPEIAKGDSNKVWILPSEFTKALEGLGSSIHEIAGIPAKTSGPLKRVDAPTIEPPTTPDSSLSQAHDEVQKAIRAAEESAASAAGRPVPAAPRPAPTPPASAPTGNTPEDSTGDPGAGSAEPQS